jgi:hypothetical protein
MKEEQKNIKHHLTDKTIPTTNKRNNQITMLVAKSGIED